MAARSKGPSVLRLSRRTWLQAAAGVAVGLPLLESLAPRHAKAAPDGPPRRFIVMYSSNGTQIRDWKPSSTGTGFAFPTILKPLEDAGLRDHVNVLSGIKMQSAMDNPNANGHASGMTSLLTGRRFTEVVGTEFGDVGWGAGISIDQEIARRVSAMGQRQSMLFGAHAKKDYDNFYAYTSYGEAGGSQSAVGATDDPREAYVDLFSNIPDASTSVEELERVVRKRKSVLDLVKGDFTRLQGKVSKLDQARLDQHAQFIRDFEQTIKVGEYCDKPDAPTIGDGDIYRNERFPDVVKAQIDLLTMAMSCDVSRVATLQLAGAQSGTVFSSFVDSDWGDGLDTYHHGLSHSATGFDQDAPNELATRANRQLTQINTWLASQLAYLGTRLASIVEPDGSTLLDNTVILWVSEISEGPTHRFTDIPYVTLGKAGGGLATGQHVDYENQRTHNELFVTLGKAMGIDGFDTFGDPEYVDQTLDDLLTGA